MGSVIRRLAMRAGVRVLDIGRQELIAAPDALAFVDSCHAERCRILGIEGFHIVDGHLQPELDAIADFSSVSEATDSAREARRFVTQMQSPDLAFVFTLAAGPEP